MPRPSRHTEAMQRLAIRTLERGTPWRTVASDWGISTGLLARWRNKYGTRPARKFPQRDASEQYYSMQFKRRAVRMLLARKIPMMQLAAELGITDTALRTWRKQFGKRKHNCPCCRCYELR